MARIWLNNQKNFDTGDKGEPAIGRLGAQGQKGWFGLVTKSSF